MVPPKFSDWLRAWGNGVIGSKTLGVRYGTFFLLPRQKHEDKSKKFGVTNIITREVALTRETNLPLNNLSLQNNQHYGAQHLTL